MSVTHVCLASLSDRRGLQIILQPPHLCSLHTCPPKAQPLKGIIQESLTLQPSRPNYSQRTKIVLVVQWFWPPEVVTSPTWCICYIYSYQYNKAKEYPACRTSGQDPDHALCVPTYMQQCPKLGCLVRPSGERSGRQGPVLAGGDTAAGATASPPQSSAAKAQFLPNLSGKEPALRGLGRAAPSTPRIPPRGCRPSRSTQVLPAAPAGQPHAAVPLSGLCAAAGCPFTQALPHTRADTCTHNQIKGLIPSSSIILYFKNRIREGGLSKIQISWKVKEETNSLLWGCRLPWQHSVCMGFSN